MKGCVPMIRKALPFLLIFLTCLGLFGCHSQAAVPTQNAASTTLPPAPSADEFIPGDGYYVLQDSAEDMLMYLQIQGSSGSLYYMHRPTPFTISDEAITISEQEPVTYTWRNSKLTFTLENVRLTFHYAGETLPQDYAPIMPPAGSYFVSSVSRNGDMEIFTPDTDQILTIQENKIGTLHFGNQDYEIAITTDQILLNGQPCSFLYRPATSVDMPFLMLYLENEMADSIALMPIS